MAAYPRRSALSLPLPARLAALALLSVLVQTGIISELPIFGVRIDITPLVVAFAGFSTDSGTGAAMGFAVGLLVDLTLGQTLGLTSLIYTFIGYGAGRLRELRDPEATLLPLALGAGAAFLALVGYAVIEFLLGVDAPVSAGELIREIVLGTIVGAIVSAPVWLLVRRVLQGTEERARRQRARTSSAGGLSPLSHP